MTIWTFCSSATIRPAATIVMVLASTALAAVRGPAATEPPSYRLVVRVEPASGTIEGRAEIQSPAATTFSLSRDLTVRRVLADEQPVVFHESALASGSSRDVSVGAPTARLLVIEYGGTIRRDSYPPVVSQVNMIRPELVELAGYVGWYPRLASAGAFTFRLVLDVPARFVTATNARLTAPEIARGGRVISEWTSDGRASDIVVVSAPGLRPTRAVRGGVNLEVLATRLPQDYVDTQMRDVAATIEALSRLIGAAPPTDAVRIVYSPRPGWGYVRQPLIVVSEENALGARAQKFGPARDLRYIAHEVAHYWWHFADVTTPDDWINEGLSEYTAFLAAGQIVGREFADQLLEEYRERSENSATTAAIAETDAGSPDREVNRYARPVIVLDEIQRKYGSERTTAFIQALYRRFTTDRAATTAAFLSEAESRLGTDAKESLARALFRKDWRDAAGKSRYVYSPKDARFLGTWTGSLTQAGTTHLVVLHLVLQGGTMVATLGSPDQGASDIPVPAVSVSGDSLYFGLGSFGITYRGVLNRDGTMLEGEWRQGGVAYPLTLTKSN